MDPATPKTEPPLSTPVPKAVFGGSQNIERPAAEIHSVRRLLGMVGGKTTMANSKNLCCARRCSWAAAAAMLLAMPVIQAVEPVPDSSLRNNISHQKWFP